MLGEKPKKTWNEAVLKWLDEMTHKKSLESDIYRFRWLDKYLNGVYLHKINKQLVEIIVDAKRRENRTNATINRYLSLIKAVLNKAKCDWEWINNTPNIKLKQESNKRIRWLTYGEAVQLLNELPAHLSAMAKFTLATGLRERNVRLLEWSQVDLTNRHAWVYGDQAKGKKAIAIPLNHEAVEVIRQQIGKNNKYIFTFKNNPVGKCNTKAFKKALKRAGIENFRWHDLRHTWASWHIQNGTSLAELKELGGWQDKDMVFRYAHLSNDRLKEAADNISGAKMVQGNLVVVRG